MKSLWRWLIHSSEDFSPLAGIVFGVGMAVGAVKILSRRSQNLNHPGHRGFPVLV
jgi:hypothetical protein